MVTIASLPEGTTNTQGTTCEHALADQIDSKVRGGGTAKSIIFRDMMFGGTDTIDSQGVTCKLSEDKLIY